MGSGRGGGRRLAHPGLCCVAGAARVHPGLAPVAHGRHGCPGGSDGSYLRLRLEPPAPGSGGGLRPPCDLCLTNALILTVAAIYLAGALIVIPAFGARHNHYAVYIQYYESLLALVFRLAVIAFALALYAVHRGMLRQRARLQEPLYELGSRCTAPKPYPPARLNRRSSRRCRAPRATRHGPARAGRKDRRWPCGRGPR